MNRRTLEELSKLAKLFRIKAYNSHYKLTIGFSGENLEKIALKYLWEDWEKRFDPAKTSFFETFAWRSEGNEVHQIAGPSVDCGASFGNTEKPLGPRFETSTRLALYLKGPCIAERPIESAAA